MIILFCIVYTSRYYNIQKIRQYQKLELRYDYTTGILLNTTKKPVLLRIHSAIEMYFLFGFTVF